MGSTVSPQLVQWASELFTSPKDRFFADARSSVKAELLLSMNLSDMTEVYGATERNMKGSVYNGKHGVPTVSPMGK